MTEPLCFSEPVSGPLSRDSPLSANFLFQWDRFYLFVCNGQVYVKIESKTWRHFQSKLSIFKSKIIQPWNPQSKQQILDWMTHKDTFERSAYDSRGATPNFFQ